MTPPPNKPSEKEQDRQKGAVPWWLGPRSREASSVLGSGASEGSSSGLLGGLRAWGSSLSRTILPALQSPAGVSLVALTALLGASYGILHVMDPKRAAAVREYTGGFLPMPGRDRASEFQDKAAEAARSLDLLAQANQNSLEQGVKKDEAADPKDSASGGSKDASGADAPEAPQAPDMAALMAQMKGQGAGGPAAGMPKVSLGGGGSGGGGFSGAPGSGGGGDSNKLASALGAGGAPAGGAGGKPSAIRPSSRKFALGSTGRGSTGPKNALGQLRFADKNSRMAAEMSGDPSKSQATKAFEGGAIGPGGTPITGGGMSTGGTGVNPGSGGPSNSGGPMGGGSGSGAGGGEETPAEKVAQNCAENPSLAGCGDGDLEGENTTPWQQMSTWAQWLLAAAGILLGIAQLIKWFAPQYSEPYGRYIAYLAGALASIVVLLGIAIMAMHGQYMQGGIFIVSGALLAYSGFTYDGKNPDPKGPAIEKGNDMPIKPNNPPANPPPQAPVMRA